MCYIYLVRKILEKISLQRGKYQAAVNIIKKKLNLNKKATENYHFVEMS